MRRQKLFILSFLGLLLSAEVSGQARSSPVAAASAGNCPVKVSRVDIISEALGCPACGCQELVLEGRHAIYNFGPDHHFPPATISSDVSIFGSPGVVASFDAVEGPMEILPGFYLRLEDIVLETEVGPAEGATRFLIPEALEFGKGSGVIMDNVHILTTAESLNDYVAFAKKNLPKKTFKVFNEGSTGAVDPLPYLKIISWESPNLVASNVTLTVPNHARVSTEKNSKGRLEVTHSGELLGALELIAKNSKDFDRVDIKNDVVLYSNDWKYGQIAVDRNFSIVGAVGDSLPLLDLSLIKSAALVRLDATVELDRVELINLAVGSKDEEKYGSHLWFFLFDRASHTGIVVKNSNLVVSCEELANLRYAIDLQTDPFQTLVQPADQDLSARAKEWEVGDVDDDLIQLKVAQGYGVEFRDVNVTCRSARGKLEEVESNFPTPTASKEQKEAAEKSATSARLRHARKHTSDNRDKSNSGFVVFKVLLALLIPIFLLLGIAFVWKLQRLRIKAKELDTQEDDSKSVALTGTMMGKRSHEVLRKGGRAADDLPQTCSSERTNGQSSTKYGSAWDMRTNQVAEFIPDILAVTENIDDKQLVLQELLGQGSSGSVHKGKWRELPVAVKTIVFRGHQNDSQERQQAAIREVAITSGLAHPNVVCTYSYDIKRLTDSEADPNGQNWDTFVDWKLYIIQEYCDGGSLKKALESCMLMEFRGPDLEKILESASGIARGIHHIHTKNIIHGDLKTNNVLLKETDQNRSGYIVKIADFGFSLKMQGSQTHVSNVQGGTPFYMAPEVLEHGSSSKAADVYAFGVILWEMYTSQFSQTGIPTPHALLHFPRLPWTCPILYAVVTVTCMQPDPARRPSFYDIVGVLSQMWQQLRLGSMIAPTGTSPQQRHRSRGSVHVSGDVYEDLDVGKAAFREVLATMPPGFQDLTFEQVYWSQTG
ncbi:hypothetical protein BSKO_01565 [Bryopsis sp. KO-2023]|nr:hypothetical protein BSKO_01565 [Bryopsis sp. KO-2023]